MAETLSNPLPAAPPKPRRVKRSWTTLTREIEGRKYTFWLTPPGCHLRLKRSRTVQTKNFLELRDFISNQLTMPL